MQHDRAAVDACGSVPAAPAVTVGVVAHGVSWKALSVVVGQGCWYASLFVLAVLIPPRNFGVIAVGSVIVSITMLALESGAGGSLIIARDLSPATIRRSLLRLTLAGFGATVLFIALAGPIADVFAGGSDPGVLRVIALTVGMAALWVVPNALLSKHLRFKVSAKVMIAATASASVVAVVAAALGAGIWALAIRLLVYQLLLTGLSWTAARDLIPPVRRGAGGPAQRVAGAPAFLIIASAGLLAWSCDTLIVGAFTNSTELGLYALAFSLAYAPLTQVSWTVGQVLLPAIAAARDQEMVRRQTMRAVRMMGLMLLPLLPVMAALAPGLIPAALGHRWAAMVVPFQILAVVGVGQGVLNILGESLAGAGVASVALRARIDITWAIATLGAIVIGVNVAGIRGAAVAHVVTFSGLAAAYVWRGGRGIGLSVTELLGAVRPVAWCVACQGIVTAAVTLGLVFVGCGWAIAGTVGTLVGVAALLAALRGFFPDLLEEGRATVLAALRRRAA